MKNAIRLFSGIAIVLFAGSYNVTYCQDTSLSVVNATGGHYSNGTLQLDFSVGEVSITSLSSGSNLVTVGFLQPLGIGALAINVLTFTGSLNAAGQSELNWTTSQEINNNHFDVERSADGKTFLKLVTVAGSGSTTVQHSYKAVDPAPFSGITYYRLKQVDNDGAFSYSNTIALVTGNGNTFVVSPNPFNSSIKVHALAQKPYAVKIFSIDGRLVAEKSFSGSETSVDLSALANGMYLLKLFSKDGNYIQSVKITKQ